MTFYNEIISSSDAYKTLHEEDAGAFGSVQVCQNTETGITVAIKYLKRVRFPAMKRSVPNPQIELNRSPAHVMTVQTMTVQGSSTISETVQQEIIAHRNLYHPNILQFKRVILNSQALGIVVEYQPGGSLDAYIQENWPLQAGAPLHRLWCHLSPTT